MTEVRSLNFQAACVRDCLNSARNDEIRAGLERAIKTLEWIEKGELVLKELVRLRKEDPELFETLRELIGMGARVDAIRKVA